MGKEQKSKVLNSYEGEYSGVSFKLTRVKNGSKIEYLYRDGDVGQRHLDKKHYDNLVDHSEVLFDIKNRVITPDYEVFGSKQVNNKYKKFHDRKSRIHCPAPTVKDESAAPASGLRALIFGAAIAIILAVVIVVLIRC